MTTTTAGLLSSGAGRPAVVARHYPHPGEDRTVSKPVTYVKDGDYRVATTAAEAVKLEFEGYLVAPDPKPVEAQRPKPAKPVEAS